MHPARLRCRSPRVEHRYTGLLRLAGSGASTSSLIASGAARPVEREALERAAVEGMLRALGDRWSTYYGRSEFTSFQSALEGHWSGVGLWLRGTPTGQSSGGVRVGSIEVGSVQPGS